MGDSLGRAVSTLLALGFLRARIGVGEGAPMKIVPCEKCGAEIIVGPTETAGFRHVSCKKCGAEFAVLNSELRVRESPAADRS